MASSSTAFAQTGSNSGARKVGAVHVGQELHPLEAEVLHHVLELGERRGRILQRNRAEPGEASSARARRRPQRPRSPCARPSPRAPSAPRNRTGSAPARPPACRCAACRGRAAGRPGRSAPRAGPGPGGDWSRASAVSRISGTAAPPCRHAPRYTPPPPEPVHGRGNRPSSSSAGSARSRRFAPPSAHSDCSPARAPWCRSRCGSSLHPFRRVSVRAAHRHAAARLRLTACMRASRRQKTMRSSRISIAV